MFDADGRKYIDFLSGAGSLNYGHNHPLMKRAILEYVEHDGIIHSLDFATTSKGHFLEQFESTILRPRHLNYKFQFAGPTGSNGVEAALKLARKVTGRRNVISFTRAYHGLTSGALAVTSNSFYRDESYINRSDVSFLPYEGYLGEIATFPYIEKAMRDPSSGVDHPAAVIVEAVQGEGGIYAASAGWLRSLAAICRELRVLLIVDDIQAGVGRTGNFFSFEFAELQPDIVVLSKSISGFGLPMTLLLIRPEIDVWKPGEHTGTFRGNNLAFVAAAEALRFWEDDAFEREIQEKSTILDSRLRKMAKRHEEIVGDVRGRGLMYGLELIDPALAVKVRTAAYQLGAIFELCGPHGNVVKLLPALTIEHEVLEAGLDILEAALGQCAGAVTPSNHSRAAHQA